MAGTNNQPDGPLQAILLETTTTASLRAAEGQKIFSPIVAFLDEHQSQTGLAPHQQNALKALSNDLANLAQQHFNAYISGVPFTLTTPAPAPASLPPSPPPSRPPSGLAQSTYASVSQITPAKVASTPKTSTRPKTPAPSQRPDTRLFVRLPPTHITKNMDAYAIYTRLRSHLSPDSKALKGVQSIKTGFTLLPASPEALSALEAQKETISTFFNNYQIKRNSR
jgi:hypothetical protein